MIAHLREHYTTTLVFGAGLLLLVLAAFQADSLRAFNAVLSTVCLILLVYRAMSTLPELSSLARALVTVLGAQLAATAVAAYLLASAAGPTTPPNTTGNVLILAARSAVIVVCVFWTQWLNSWTHWPGQRRPRVLRGPTGESPPRVP